MKKLAIIGSGDLGQQIAYHAIHDQQFEVVGFFDDFKIKGTLVDQVPVLGGMNDVSSRFEEGLFEVLLLGIGYKHMAKRAEVFDQFRNKIPFARLIHSSSLVDASCTLGEGTVVYPGCLLDQKVVIHENVLINVGCCIAHHSEIGAHSFLSPRVAIAGFVTIEERCIIGINATLIDNLKIAAQTQIGAGAVVIKSIEKHGLYVGNPIKFIR